MSDCKDILLAETGDGSPVLIKAPSHTFYPGLLVAYDGGKYAIVQQRAWVGNGDELWDILSSVAPVYDLEEAFTSVWKRKGEENVPGAS